MPNKAVNIAEYEFTFSDSLLLDTNVWMFVYGPQQQKDRRSDIYSRALSRILAARCRIYIDVLIVSEFVNRYARIMQSLIARESKFKDFRQSNDFIPVAQDIAAELGRILLHCTRVDSGFDALAIDALINEFAQGQSDFNDQVLSALCAKSGFTLVTDDSDFKGRGIPILTGNKRLFA
jgi:predicted nucleic acid-binding protein